jgi:hypothetical protein
MSIALLLRFTNYEFQNYDHSEKKRKSRTHAGFSKEHVPRVL